MVDKEDDYDDDIKNRTDNDGEWGGDKKKECCGYGYEIEH